MTVEISEENAKNFDAKKWKFCERPHHKTMEGRFVRLEPLKAGKHGDELYAICAAEPERFAYLPEDPPKNREEFQVGKRKISLSFRSGSKKWKNPKILCTSQLLKRLLGKLAAE